MFSQTQVTQGGNQGDGGRQVMENMQGMIVTRNKKQPLDLFQVPAEDRLAEAAAENSTKTS